jgi:predicted PurR-regulated permease PerM
MNLARPITFWIAMCAATIAAVVLLRDILLPFVAGLVLAYLFNPMANRLERLGLNRLLAALVIIGVFVVGFILVALLTVSFIPYLGSITGLVIATCVAIAQFWPQWAAIAMVPVIFFVGQTVADYVLSPYLVGRASTCTRYG